MNDDRRKILDQAMALIEQARELVSRAAEEEQDYYDNMPEAFQSGEKGDKAQETADNLQNLDGDLEAVIDTINEAKE